MMMHYSLLKNLFELKEAKEKNVAAVVADYIARNDIITSRLW